MPKYLSVPTGSAAVARLLSTSGKAALFHEKTKANIEVTMTPGRMSGSTMRLMIVAVEAPSTRAASSISTGTSSIKLRNSQIENGMVSVCRMRIIEK